MIRDESRMYCKVQFLTYLTYICYNVVIPIVSKLQWYSLFHDQKKSVFINTDSFMKMTKLLRFFFKSKVKIMQVLLSLKSCANMADSLCRLHHRCWFNLITNSLPFSTDWWLNIIRIWNLKFESLRIENVTEKFVCGLNAH